MTDATLDQEILSNWIGKQKSTDDIISVKQAQLMQATLNRQPSLNLKDDLPPLWHWIYFHDPISASNLGRDGHEKLGNFLPPINLPRRQWAGSRFWFNDYMKIGDEIAKCSTIKSIEMKQGKTGQLCFVTVFHEYYKTKFLLLDEEHDIVYREAPKTNQSPPPPKQAPTQYDWQETITPNQVLLFRYSALTFNGHRIHYDKIFSKEEEGYQGLIVHGPLIATLLIDLAVRKNPDKKIRYYEFRAVNSLFENEPFKISGKQEEGHIDLWAENLQGHLAMNAKLEFF